MGGLFIDFVGEGAAEKVAERLADALRDGLKARGRASMVATGGATPGPVYDALARKPLAWSRVEIVLSDERWRPLDHPDSNERMVRSRLLAGPAAAARLVSLKAETDAPEQAESEIAQRLAGMARPFDVVLLGMGADGHFASLFPGMDRLAEALDPGGAHLCLGVRPGEGRPPAEPRMSLTLAALAAARRVVLFMTGQDKAAALQRALEGDNALEMPVRALIRANVPLEIIVG